MSDDVKAAAASYANAFRTSSDPLFRVVGTVGTVVGGVGNAAAGRVRDWWQQGRDDADPETTTGSVMLR